ncbi:MAG: DUF1499 domain-containing protein [Myxococcota bacterium]
MGRSLVAAASGWLGFLALAAAGLGALGSMTGLVSPFIGFRIFTLGVVLAPVALVLGVVGLLRTRTTTGRAGRGHAVLGTAGGAGMLAIVAVAAAPTAGLPVINDITTNPSDPPVFAVAPAEVGTPMPYPGESFASLQRDAYPELTTVQLSLAPAQALERARLAAEELGLEVVSVDPDAGTLEGQHVSAVFRFVDDVVVRVRPSGEGSQVDIRSRSRDGRGDLGVNAARVHSLCDAIQ